MEHIDLHDYEITLLTKEEYEAHRKLIPPVFCWWWLRSPGSYSYYAALVLSFGSVDLYGHGVDNDYDAVRPALRSEILDLPIGERFIALSNRWVMIDEGFAVSESVIGFHRFDEKSNDWETSELKAWLEVWAKEGEDMRGCFDDKKGDQG